MRPKRKQAKIVEFRKGGCCHHDKVEEEEDFTHKKFTMEQLKDIKTIRRINKTTFK